VSKIELKEWPRGTFYVLNNLWLQKSNIASALKCRTFTHEEQNNTLSEREITGGNISLMTDERKRMDTGIARKCKVLAGKKKVF
jgi:hypothetical protein